METMYERAVKVMPPVAGRSTKLGVIKAEGSYLYTENGEKVLDFASGVAVCNIGHNHPEVVKAAEEQLHQMIHGGHNVVYYESYVRLAEKLVELTGGQTMVYFSNSGAEANDGAMKLAKFYTKRPAIISFKGSFHGRTIGCTSITSSSAVYRKDYEGLLPSVYFLDYPNLYRSPFQAKEGTCPEYYFKQFDDLFHNLVDPYSVAAVILEPVQGEGGYIVPPKEWVQYVREICTKYGIMLIFDEIQTGNGRTGKLFAQEHFEVQPDIFTTAKGIASGFPLSAIIAKKEIMEKWSAGAHGGTFGGNPVACAAGIATLEVLQREGLNNAAEMGAYFREQLLKLQGKYPGQIGEVRGLGLMLAIELVDENKEPDAQLTNVIKEEALKRNVLLLNCGTYKNVIRFIPSTLVKKEEIDVCMEVLTGILDSEGSLR